MQDHAGQWRPVYADGVLGDPLTRELADLHTDVEAALAAVQTDDEAHRRTHARGEAALTPEY